MRLRHWARGVLSLFLLSVGITTSPAAEVVTIAGTGKAGHSGDGGPALQAELDQPFGLEIGPDGALYFCEYGSHIIRRMDLTTGILTTVAGTPYQQGQAGDGGPAAQAVLGQPHELRFGPGGDWLIASMTGQAIRDVSSGHSRISTVAGTGKAGFSGDGGPAVAAELNQPISVVWHPKWGILVCDIKNHRIRQVDPNSGVISTFAGTGIKGPTSAGSPRQGTPLNGPRTLAVERDGSLIVVLREGNAVYRLRADHETYEHITGTGKKGFTGDGGDARKATLSGPKGVALDADGNIWLCDTENHCVRIIDQKTGIIRTAIGDGQKGDGPDGDPARCRLNRPHGVFVAADGAVYVGDSENHKVRKLTLAP